MARGMQGMSVVRGGMLASCVAMPFVALREVIAAGTGVEGRMASVIAGGFAGYVGGLVVCGGRWRVVGEGVLLGGMGCGVLDWVVGGLQWRRKVWMVGGDAKSWDWEAVDGEYEELLERRRVTAEALEREQRRIELLVRALEQKRRASGAAAEGP